MPGRGALAKQLIVGSTLLLPCFGSAFAQDGGSNVPSSGFFIGVGGSFNAANVDQHSAAWPPLTCF
jgi:hypothetical protein